MSAENMQQQRDGTARRIHDMMLLAASLTAKGFDLRNRNEMTENILKTWKAFPRKVNQGYTNSMKRHLFNRFRWAPVIATNGSGGHIRNLNFSGLRLDFLSAINAIQSLLQCTLQCARLSCARNTIDFGQRLQDCEEARRVRNPLASDLQTVLVELQATESCWSVYVSCLIMCLENTMDTLRQEVSCPSPDNEIVYLRIPRRQVASLRESGMIQSLSKFRDILLGLRVLPRQQGTASPSSSVDSILSDGSHLGKFHLSLVRSAVFAAAVLVFELSRIRSSFDNCHDFHGKRCGVRVLFHEASLEECNSMFREIAESCLAKRDSENVDVDASDYDLSEIANLDELFDWVCSRLPSGTEDGLHSQSFLDAVPSEETGQCEATLAGPSHCQSSVKCDDVSQAPCSGCLNELCSFWEDLKGKLTSALKVQETAQNFLEKAREWLSESAAGYEGYQHVYEDLRKESAKVSAISEFNSTRVVLACIAAMFNHRGGSLIRHSPDWNLGLRTQLDEIRFRLSLRQSSPSEVHRVLGVVKQQAYEPSNDVRLAIFERTFITPAQAMVSFLDFLILLSDRELQSLSTRVKEHELPDSTELNC